MSTVVGYNELRRNLVRDPRGTNLAGWNTTAGTGGAGVASLLTSITDHPLGIATAYRHTWTVSATASGSGLRAGTAEAVWGTAAVGGVTYSGSLYARVNRSRDVRPVMIWYDAAGATLATSNGTVATCAANTWARYSMSVVAPAGAAWVRMAFYGTSTVWLAGDVADATAALVEASPTVGGYFDGDSVGPVGSTLSYAWTGTAQASPSILRQQVDTTIFDEGGAWKPRSAVVWGLGDYDSPQLRFNGVDEFGVEWICETPEGWNRTSADTPVVEGGGDGGNFAPGRRKPKVMTLRGAFRCGDVTRMEAAAGRLRAAIEYFTEDTTLWHGPTPTGSPARQMSVRLSGELDVPETTGNPRIRTFSAVLTAADPFRYAAGSSGLVTMSTRLPKLSDLPGVSFPAGFPMDFGGSDTADGDIYTFNPGDVGSFPTVTFTGPGFWMQLHHQESGAVCGYKEFLLDGQKVIFDHETRAVTADGRSVFQNRMPGTSFFTIAPKGNTLALVADAYDPAALVTVSYRPRWR